MWAIVVDRDYIQRYRYGHPLAAVPFLTNLTTNTGVPMEVVGLPTARKSQKSPGVKGTPSAFGVPQSSHPVISNRDYTHALPPSWRTIAALAPIPGTRRGKRSNALARASYVPSWLGSDSGGAGAQRPIIGLARGGGLTPVDLVSGGRVG